MEELKNEIEQKTVKILELEKTIADQTAHISKLSKKVDYLETRLSNAIGLVSGEQVICFCEECDEAIWSDDIKICESCDYSYCKEHCLKCCMCGDRFCEECNVISTCEKCNLYCCSDHLDEKKHECEFKSDTESSSDSEAEAEAEGNNDNNNEIETQAQIVSA